MGTASIKHPVPDRVKPSFVMFDIRALSDVKHNKWRLNPVWHRMLCSYTHMAPIGVKRSINHYLIWSDLIRSSSHGTYICHNAVLFN